MERSLLERRAENVATFAAEDAERAAEIEAIRSQRHVAATATRRITLGSGRTLSLYIGAYVHAYRQDTDWHAYGMVVRFTPKACYVAPPNRNYDDRIVYSKFETIEELSEDDWSKVSDAFAASDSADGKAVSM